MKDSIYYTLCCYIRNVAEERYGTVLTMEREGGLFSYSFDTWYFEGVNNAEIQALSFLNLGYMKVTIDGNNIYFAK